MRLVNYIKAHVFHNFDAAVKLARKEPSLKNTKLLEKICSIKHTSKKLTQNANYMSYQYQKSVLPGKSIEPSVVANYLDKVVFNGFGEIVSLKYPLEKSDYNVLVDHVIKPLKEAPTANADEKIRTAAECLIDMACVIKKSNIHNDKKN